MALILALLEAGLIFAVACGAIFVSVQPLLTGWMGIAAWLAPPLALTLCCIVAFYYSDLYDLHIVDSFAGFASRLPRALALALVLLAGVYLLLPEARRAESAFIASLLIVFGLIVPARVVSYELIRSGRFGKRVLVLGTSPLARRLIEEIESQPHRGYTVVGVVDDCEAPKGWPVHHPVLGPLPHLDEITQEIRPDRIVVALSKRRGQLPVRQLLGHRARGILVEDGVGFYERLTGKLAIEWLAPSSLIFSPDFRKSRLTQVVERTLDLAVSLLGLVALAPLLGVIALAIKLDSRGPLFFVHERVGRWGVPFRLAKFRTMHPTTGATSEWVRDNGDRVTRVGKWLRRFRLDELPQFVNILRGDMSLVGPRPHPVSNFKLFLEQIPYYSFRSVVRPGVTGWSQVRYGYANDLEEETEKMRYDLYYIKHMSLGFDLRILFDTAKIVLLGRGSRAADVYRTKAASGEEPARPVFDVAPRPSRVRESAAAPSTQAVPRPVFSAGKAGRRAA